MRHWAILAAFPILGSALALLFRPSELDWRSLQPPAPPAVDRLVLAAPGGHRLTFLGLPDVTDGVAFFLSETEVPDALWRVFSDQPPSHASALAFCAWLSGETGRTLRLPTAAEWRWAARGGVPSAEFPWGFGPPVPPPDLHFALEKPPRSPGPALGTGFRDLAGGRWEWTAEGLLLGAAWSERDPELLRIDHAWTPPPGYQGRDTGIRLLLEP